MKYEHLLQQEANRKIGARCIITVMEHLTRWVEIWPLKDCTSATTTKFLFENVLT